VNVAAIDIGTNSVRLLVTDGASELDRRVITTRLGQGVAGSGRLHPDAVARTLACLAELRGALHDHAVADVRAVATAVLRDVSDGDDFVAEVGRVLGAPLEILDGEEEALLSFVGATADLEPERGPFLVLDIGGGSTELSVGVDHPEASVSLPVGSVRLTETQLLHDPPLPEELTNAIGLVEDHLADALRAAPALADARTIVGVAGSIISIAAVELGRYDREALHHFVLTRDAAEEVFRTLATEPVSDRRANPGLQPERADIIVGGCCALVSVLRTLKAGELLVSESDLLDAVAASLLV
jgi:exopolyphosphatase/guanosine-5'-triphosphate,3'-diphosphate pyrophosphatase